METAMSTDRETLFAAALLAFGPPPPTVDMEVGFSYCEEENRTYWNPLRDFVGGDHMAVAFHQWYDNLAIERLP